jgi:hypothetical protein
MAYQEILFNISEEIIVAGHPLLRVGQRNVAIQYGTSRKVEQRLLIWTCMNINEYYVTVLSGMSRRRWQIQPGTNLKPVR